VRAAAAAAAAQEKRVLILGGTGRVGRSTAAALSACGVPLALTLAARDAGRFETLRSGASGDDAWLHAATFLRCDIDDPASLAAALAGVDLVIHAAGPFQRAPRCAVLEAALAARVPYLDVCDDTAYAQRAKTHSAAAAAAGVRAVICGGLFPGVSNVMAAQIVRADAAASDAPPAPPKRVAYYYFTAGSGGAGTTILATSFLLCGEDALAFKDGQPVRVPPVTGRRVVDFGRVRERSGQAAALDWAAACTVCALA
jgi:saccharopine dehydrogenase-like NADP-dependent oxidoreductase